MKYIARRQSFAGFLLMIVFSLLLAGCGGGGGSKSSTPVLKAIVLEPTSATVPVGGERQFTAVGKDQNGKTMGITPTWSVTGGIGTVSQSTGTTTTFTATAVGEGTIVAKVGDISGSAVIIVSEEEAVLTTIEISPSSVTIVKEDTQEFSVTGRDQFGEEINLPAAAVWTVEGNVGSLSTNQGQTVTFTATTVGDGTIKASVESLTGEAQVKVVEAGDQPVLLKIEVSPGYSEFGKGETKTFTATGYDQYDNELTINPTWSLSGTGMEGTFNPETGPSTTFTANSFGWGVITASVGYISGTADITVFPGLAEITVNPDSAIILEGETMTFEALGYHEQGLPTSINPTWSVTGNIGTVSPSTGSTTTFTATGGGTGTIVATDGEIFGSAEIQVVPKVLRVGLGHDCDYATIQEAINAAIDGVTIEVDEGTYTENLTIDKSITLKSTDPDTPSVVASTIINGGGSGTVWVTRLSGNEPAVNIEGLTITGGSMGVRVSNSNTPLSVSLKKNVICGNHGFGGVSVVENDLQLTLEGNTIENNWAESEGGGGICLDGSYDDKIQVTMTDNIIRNNSANGSYGAGGGIHARYVEGTWTGNTIDENSAVAYAGGIYLYDSSPVIIDNDIINNEVISDGYNRRGGGIYIEKSTFGICNPTIQNNRISGNVAQGSDASSGGGLYIKSPGLTLTGNTISNNSAAFGGGIMAGADTTLVNNIISGNTASGNGGGLGVAFGVGVVNISGNEFTGNTAPEGGGVFVSSNSGLTGSGNIFNNNEEYAIYLHWDGATWTDGGGNAFSGNTPSDVGP